ncbi:MAG: RdgB/HAM1 family non-canonical purine NTP pyrophosphatase [Luminiphilus sp.]|nr:RdgB/HAM1 family non-canonical purine NTP pyrophosphatase [Luminiphilus sp.]
MKNEHPPVLVIASHNTGKIREFEHVFTPHWRIEPQAAFGVSEAAETGLTFLENALIKARHACTETGNAALADDSGLVVPALGGEPGLHSARYSGGDNTANNALLLENMRAFQGADRAAFYVAVLVLLKHADDPTPIIAEGRWHGHIAESPKGNGGFGYDPIFIPEGSTQHAAELSTEEKNRVSHRAIASAQLLVRLRE